ncbi:MAG: hypothetical protein KY395_06155, partial [Actinobacteria bacterium]|nr:hypothetical protein [Actinomycetota bacterium]
ALADIDQPSVVEWAGDLADELAPATVKKGHQILGSCLQAAVDAGLIAASPVRNIPLPTVRRTEMRFLTAAEVARWSHPAVADPAWALAFRSDAAQITAVGPDGTARIWDLGGAEVAQLAGRSPVRAVALRPDGQYLATGSTNGTARVWALAEGSDANGSLLSADRPALQRKEQPKTSHRLARTSDIGLETARRRGRTSPGDRRRSRPGPLREGRRSAVAN